MPDNLRMSHEMYVDESEILVLQANSKLSFTPYSIIKDWQKT